MLRFIFGFSVACSLIAASARAQDMPLSQVLMPGEEWQVVSEGHGFVDGLTANAEGNVFFSDLGKGKIFTIGADGNATESMDQPGKASGLKFGADGSLYAALNGAKKIVKYDREKKESVLASDVSPNDLVVTKSGNVYFTDTPGKKVWLIPAGGEKRVVDEGIEAPNGIALWPDQQTLIVSDYAGNRVWAFRIEADGSLSFKQPYYTLRLAVGQTKSGGDGSTVDSKGRAYVTSLAGVQMFDPTGRESGLILRPQNKPAVSVCFGGPDFSYLYLASADKIYRRKTATTGVSPTGPAAGAK